METDYEIIIKFSDTGFCEINVENVVKYWDDKYAIIQWNDENTLIKHSSSGDRDEIKVKITPETANGLKNRLGLIQTRSIVFASASSWNKPGANSRGN